MSVRELVACMSTACRSSLVTITHGRTHESQIRLYRIEAAVQTTEGTENIILLAGLADRDAALGLLLRLEKALNARQDRT